MVQLHLYGAVNMIAGFMDALGQTQTIYQEQLALNSEQSKSLLKKEKDYNENLDATSTSWHFGMTGDYQDLQKEALINQNLTSSLTNNEGMISGMVSNNANEIFGLSMTGKTFIGAYSHMSQTGLRG
jgi:lambda family phage tail tape measure protein